MSHSILCECQMGCSPKLCIKNVTSVAKIEKADDFSPLLKQLEVIVSVLYNISHVASIKVIPILLK